MNTIEILNQNNIKTWRNDNDYVLQCPFCKKMDVIGSPVFSFNIDLVTGGGSCGDDKCKKKEVNQVEFLKALGIDTQHRESVEVGDSDEKVDTETLQKYIFRFWSIGEILAQDFGEEEWLIQSIIPKQGMAVLSGNPGDYKTWVTIHTALCVARGLPVFGQFKVSQGAVLIIDEEDNLRLIQKRLKLLGALETDEIYYLSQSGIKVDDIKTRDFLVSFVREKNIKLVILDSLVRVHQQDENDARSIAKVFGYIQQIMKVGASIFFTHHHRKQQGHHQNNSGQSMRGSSDILAAVDCHITIEKKKDEESLILRQHKLRQGELLPPFEIKILNDGDGPSGFAFVGQYEDRKKKAEEVADALIYVLADGIKSRPDIQEALGEEFGKEAIDAGLKIAEELRKIERVPKQELSKAERKIFYRLTKELPASCLPIHSGNQDDVSIAYVQTD